MPSSDQPRSSAPEDALNLLPSFLRVDDVMKRTGLTKTKLYQWMREGKIRSVCLRDPGAKRGIRLIDAQSLAEFINGFGDGFDEAGSVTPPSSPLDPSEAITPDEENTAAEVTDLFGVNSE